MFVEGNTQPEVHISGRLVEEPERPVEGRVS